ncbi:peptidylprolyl isomerase [Niabella drilacis]|uniref:Periplasmic chaperone PpiD n=1 Tax=Niabella drilacis (strain DSM 25811 / CCM 8410 / CCUG 62505 / LMG 26954 / E90) TaxID=1285928 RepID=A0A1G7C5J0_NIADE|nr:peptidylprolyl isomerase [Niabella drilacis]SDE34503.1 peptidyl-prolyl cis-trans isomerase D [Niabella drilacis]
MSVIQKIQDKYGKVMAVIIGLALVIFVVMLAFENGGSLFTGDVRTIGKVNGEKIEFPEFSALVEQRTQMMQAQGMSGGEGAAQQANEMAWGQEVSRILLSQESQKLGLDVGRKELNDLLFGANPPQELAQGFTDPQTGKFDAAAAQAQINQIKSKGTPEQKAQINLFLDQLILQRKAEKYDALLTTSINFPKWMIEKQSADDALMSKVSFVSEPYTSVSDSSVKITESDIQDYINKHKTDFKQQESRSIAYVAFNAQPNGADSIAARQRLLDLKPAFDSAHNVKDFLVSEGINNYYDGFISSNRIQVPMKDSILKVGTGNIYGPYVDANNYALAKIVATTNMPDTVKVRHILIGLATQDPQTGQQIPLRDSATARKLADSLFTALQKGSSFDTLVAKFSTDGGSLQTGGVFDNVPSGQMTPAFNDYIFTHPAGSKGIVKTEYGYHIVEVLSTKGSTTGYKIAYVTKPIEASQETDNTASNAATHFAAQATDQKTFNAAAEKLMAEKGILKSIASDIPPTGAMIQGLGASRAFVKNVYKADLGDVVQPERVGDYYVVGLVTEINKEGTMSTAKARARVEPLLINQKKAKIITDKIGKVTTLEAAATVLKKQVETADSLRFNGQTPSAIGFEPKVLGAAFNKANLQKVVPEAIAGSQGVYVIRVDNLMSTPSPAQNPDEIRRMRYMQAKQQAQFQSIQALREAATIKDYRSKFY